MPDYTQLARWHEMPIIEIPAAFCHPHWEEFLARREPERAVVVMALKLWELLILDEAFAKRIGSWREAPAEWVFPTDFSLMNDTMRVEPFTPWCCYLGEERREAAWLNTPLVGIKEKES